MMIRLEKGNNCFNYRVVGVAVHDNAVLLHQAAGDDFWTFPGGRAELGEPAEQTLKREMREEIGMVSTAAGRLIPPAVAAIVFTNGDSKVA